jgi:thioredoxin reductase (NADPH)
MTIADDADPLDCLIVGAGPGGLTAAIYLGRFHRRALVLHDGDARAGWIPTSHNHPGFPDGVHGVDLLALMTDQAERYGADVRRARVTGLSRTDGLFAVETDHGAFRARHVILATGVKDVQPPLPGVFNAVQRGLVRVCPICDGYEVTGKSVGIIGRGPHGAREALFLRSYTDLVTLVHVGDPDELTAAHRAALRAHAIDVVDTPAESVAVEKDRIEALCFQGVNRRFDSVYSALGMEPRSELAVQAGAQLSEDGRLVVDDHQMTSVDGLYAAGDVVRGLNQISIAQGEGAQAAVDVHNRLRRAEGLTL